MRQRAWWPSIARWILALGVPGRGADAIVGDLREEADQHRLTRFWLLREALKIAGRMLFARSVGIRATINRETRRTGDSTMSGILQDVRFALRGFRNSPELAAVAILTLALGIGANTAVSSIVDGVLLKALPYPDPDRMVRIYSSWEQSDRGNVSPMDFLDWQDQASSFSAVAAIISEDYAHIGTGELKVVFAAEVTPGFFEVVAVDTALGRPFVGDDGGPGADPVVVLSDGFWQRSFGSDPDVIGRSLRLETGSATIVGVMPPGFVLHGWSDTGPDFWINMVLDRADNNRGGHFLGVIGRLREDVQLTSARSEMDTIGRDLAELYPRKLALDGDPPLLMASVRERIWRTTRCFRSATSTPWRTASGRRSPFPVSSPRCRRCSPSLPWCSLQSAYTGSCPKVSRSVTARSASGWRSARSPPPSSGW